MIGKTSLDACFILGISSVMRNVSAYKNLGHDSHWGLVICRRVHLILKMANTTGFLRFICF